MRCSPTAATLAASLLVPNVLASRVPAVGLEERADKIAPKVLIISMFSSEGDAWYGIDEFDVLERNITVPGFRPLYPDLHCTANGEICQLTTGEAEINAATTIASLVRYTGLDLTKTYFMVAGIAGVNPEVTTICAVTFARYAVQVTLQYQISQLELPSNYSTGYIPFGTVVPRAYPKDFYGTEVFEFNKDLQSLAANMARKADLADTELAKKYRAKYAVSPAYKAGASPPSVVECDVATADVWWSGEILANTFANYTKLVTNGTATYCSTAEEDNGTAEAFLRAAVQKLVDFSRIIVMRTASDFDRPYPGESATENLFWADTGAFGPSIENIYRAGVKVVEGIVEGWDSTFEKGVKPSNYIGDILGTLGGTPNFGPYAYGNNPLKRDVLERTRMRRGKSVRAFGSPARRRPHP